MNQPKEKKTEKITTKRKIRSKRIYKNVNKIVKNRTEIPFGTKPVITNIVASGRLSKEIDIAKIYQEVDFVESVYEPETYPALLVKIMVNGNKRHVTLYKNGKFIITGAISEKDVNEIYNEIIKILKQNNFL